MMFVFILILSFSMKQIKMFLGNINSLNVLKIHVSTDFCIYSLISSPLFKSNGDNFLCKEIFEDGGKIVVKIKETYWENGEKVTTQQLKDFFLMIANKNSTAPYLNEILSLNIQGIDDYHKGRSTDIEGIDIINDFEIRFSFINAISINDFKKFFAFGLISPIRKDMFEKYQEDFGNSKLSILSSGLYKIASNWHTGDNEIVFVKNEKCLLDNYETEKIVIYISEADPQTVKNAFIAGKTNFAMNIPSLDLKEYENYGEIFQTDSNIVIYAGLNCRKNYLNSKIRKAIVYSFDYEFFNTEIIDTEKKIIGVVPNSIWKYEENRYEAFKPNSIDYNAMFKEGMQENQKKGIKLKDIELEIIYNKDSIVATTTVQYLQNHIYEKFKLNVSVVPLLPIVRINKMVSGEFSIGMMGWGFDYNDPVNILNIFVSDNGNNHIFYNNKNFDNLILKASSETDPFKKELILKQAEIELFQDPPLIPLYVRISNMVYNGFSLKKHELNPLSSLCEIIGAIFNYSKN